MSSFDTPSKVSPLVVGAALLMAWSAPAHAQQTPPARVPLAEAPPVGPAPAPDAAAAKPGATPAAQPAAAAKLADKPPMPEPTARPTPRPTAKPEPEVALVAAATAQPPTPRFPTRDGESGLLDVPDAETRRLGGGAFVTELRFEGGGGGPIAVGPSPLAVGMGLGRFEGGFSLREGGRPGDPRPSSTTLGTVLKLHIADPFRRRPAFAIDAGFDRMNYQAVSFVRALASTIRERPFRAAAYVGGELGLAAPEGGPTAGLAVAARRGRYEGVAEVTAGLRGAMLGSAFRIMPSPMFGVGVGLDWLPSDHAVRAALSVALISPEPPLPPSEVKEEPAAAKLPTRPVTKKKEYTDERPRFRLRVRPKDVPGHPARSGPDDEAPSTLPPRGRP